MKEFDHIDELIRQKFEGFEPVPPESVWEKVKAGIGPDAPAPGNGRITPPIITGLIVLVGLISMLFLVTRMESTLPGAKAGSTELLLNAGRYAASDAPIAQADMDETSAIDNSTTYPIPVRKPFDGTQSLPSAILNTMMDDTEPATSPEMKNHAASREERFSQPTGRMKGKTSRMIEAGNPDAADEPSGRRTNLPPTSGDYAAPVRPAWSLGACFNPELNFNPLSSNSNELGYSVQLLPRVNFGNWFVQSGLGVRLGHDEGNYVVNYNKYLGSYQDVYEVTFDSTEQGVVPIYHTRLVDVYDTVPYYSISETNIRYTYLDIPLEIGHEWSIKRFSVSLHAGPSLSLLVDRSSPTADYPDERIRILSEAPQIPARENISWQLTAGAGFTYSFGGNFRFSLEPTFRYYLSGEYQDDNYNTAHPYSIGVRAGLIYQFNHSGK